MAKPSGHKANCKCVACSPATRKRGQAALAASRGTAKPRKNPASSPAKPKPARTNPGAPQVVVVQAPPPAAPKRRAPRKNPAAAPAARETTPRKNPPARACPHLPSDVRAGGYVVLATHSGDGGRLRPVKTFSRISDADAYARELPDGSKAIVLEVRKTWG